MQQDKKTDLSHKTELSEIKSVNKKMPALTKSETPKFKSPFDTFFRKRIDTAFGIDISDSSIELMEFKAFFSHKPRSYSRVHLEKGIVEKGKILEKDILEQKLKILLQSAKPKKVSTNRVIMSLPEAQVFTWSTAINKSISGDELKNKIFEEAKKFIPLDFKKIYWDYVTYQIPKKDLQYVTFVGISQDVLNDYVEVAHRLGLEIVDFSLVSMCLGKVFLPPIEKDTHVILDIGGEKSNITIFEGNTLLKLSATIPVAGYMFNKEISQGMGITELEAEEMKIKFGTGEGAPAQYTESINKILKKLIDEVKKSIKYYEDNSGETVDAIYLTGGSSMLIGLNSYIENATGIKIKQMNSLPFISKSSVFEKEINLNLFMNAVGLALLGITKNSNAISFRKKILIGDNKKSFFQIIKTGNFDKQKMIFSYTHVVYGSLTLLVIILITIFTLMWLEL